jgi:hypothetical protein
MSAQVEPRLDEADLVEDEQLHPAWSLAAKIAVLAGAGL